MSVLEVTAGNVLLICIGVAGVICIGVFGVFERIRLWRIEREYKALLKRDKDKD